jgi:hypothetical protein
MYVGLTGGELVKLRLPDMVTLPVDTFFGQIVATQRIASRTRHRGSGDWQLGGSVASAAVSYTARQTLNDSYNDKFLRVRYQWAVVCTFEEGTSSPYLRRIQVCQMV